jgi:hypothetical protein
MNCNRTELDETDAGRLTNQVVNGMARSYAYSFRSQVTGLTDTNAATGNYAFDGDGNRISMIPVGTAGPAVRFVYDGPNAVLDIENGVVKAAYVQTPTKARNRGHVPTINN